MSSLIQTEQKRWRSHDDPTQFSQDFTNVALNCICYPQFKILVYNRIIIWAYPSSYTQFNGNRSFPNRWRDTLDAAATHVANRKDSRQTGFEQVRRTSKGPACIFIVISKRMKGKDNLSTYCSAKSLKLAFDMIFPRTLLEELIREHLQRKT